MNDIFCSPRFPRLPRVPARVVIAVLITLCATTGGIARAGEQQLPLQFAGGHDLARHDYGRPCALMAAALGVTTDQFRQAFSGVKPARGREPSDEERRRNKEALMSVLSPLGVTNERMDEVANFYRFRPQNGELWPHREAVGYAVVDRSVVKRLVITDGGFGYNTPPTVTICEMPAVRLEAKLSFDKDMRKNGAVASVTPVK